MRSRLDQQRTGPALSLFERIFNKTCSIVLADEVDPKKYAITLVDAGVFKFVDWLRHNKFYALLHAHLSALLI